MMMDAKTVRDINSRLFFGSAGAWGSPEIRPWQYVEMEYGRMGLSTPQQVPPMESIEDAQIWMCLDERVNRTMRMRERQMAG